MRDTDEVLIDTLVGDLKPVRAMHYRAGLAYLLLAFAVMLLIGFLLPGPQGMLLKAETQGFAFLANGLFLLLGLAASAGAVFMGMPQVGNRQDGWKWALGAMLLVPAFALVNVAPVLGDVPQRLTLAGAWRELHCILIGFGLGLFAAAAMILWLRRGAPSSPERAGFLVGLGAASLGIFAFGLSCPYEDLAHVGLSHSLCIVLGAAVGRLAVPRLVRW